MKNKVHPGVFAAVIILFLIGAGIFVSRAFNSGVVGVIYAPGQEPKSTQDPSQRDTTAPRDPGKSGGEADEK